MNVIVMLLLPLLNRQLPLLLGWAELLLVGYHVDHQLLSSRSKKLQRVEVVVIFDEGSLDIHHQ
jgi:hypothetical protein